MVRLVMIFSKKRAFIGPLGDDIPSIFPIIGGFILFIASIAYVASLFDSKNVELSKRKTALDLSYLVTDRGYLDDFEFTGRCTAMRDFAEKRAVNFVAVMQKHCNQMYLSGSTFVISGVAYKKDPESKDVFYQDYPSESSSPQSYSALIASKGFKLDKLKGRICSKVKDDTKVQQEAADNFNISTILSYPVAVNCDGQRGFGLINLMVWRARA